MLVAKPIGCLVDLHAGKGQNNYYIISDSKGLESMDYCRGSYEPRSVVDVETENTFKVTRLL